MRAGTGAVAVALVVLGGCTGDDRAGRRAPTTPPSTASMTVPTPSSTPPTTVAPAPGRPTIPSGSVVLVARDVTLPDPRSGGTGLRLLVRAASPRLSVHRRGGGGAVAVCPAAGATAPVAAGGCADLGPDATVEVPFVGGVELRATGPGATVEEVAVTYAPADRTTTLVTPAQPAGGCAPTACEAAFSLLPGRAGAFSLDGQAAGGGLRLVLESVPAGDAAGGGAGGAGSNRTLATVEGGGNLSIRATLEAGRQAELLHHVPGPGPVAPVTAEISWP